MKIEAVRLSCKRDPVWAKEARDRGASNGDLIVRAGGRVFHCYEINVGRERPSTGFRVDRRGDAWVWAAYALLPAQTALVATRKSARALKAFIAKTLEEGI